jgi:hypothetical protein
VIESSDVQPDGWKDYRIEPDGGGSSCRHSRKMAGVASIDSNAHPECSPISLPAAPSTRAPNHRLPADRWSHESPATIG